MDIAETEQQIIDEFAIFDDWLDKYNLLIEMGRDLPLIDARYKTNNHLISGCQSRVWLHADLANDGKVKFPADSDAVITKGLVNLLIRVLSERTPDENTANRPGISGSDRAQRHHRPLATMACFPMVKPDEVVRAGV